MSRKVRQPPTEGVPIPPSSRLPRVLGSLRRRFGLLLVFLAVSSLLPWALATGLHAHLDGFGRRLELAGSLRYQTLELLLITGGRSAELPLAAEEIADLVRAQEQILERLITGHEAGDVPPCIDADVCERLQGLQRDWLAQVSPRTDPFPEPGSPAAVGLANVLLRQLAATDRTVQAMADRLDARVDEIVWRGFGALVVSLILLAMVGFGVWEVFVRIRGLEEASSDPPREAELEAQGRGSDEVASLARTLLSSLRSLRLRNEADRLRTAELDAQQQALRSLAAGLGAWIEGRGPLEEPLVRAAVRAGFTGAHLEGLEEGDALGHEGPVAAGPNLGPMEPLATRGDGDGLHLEVPLAWGDLLLARLHLERDAPATDPETLAVVDAFGRTVAISLVAKRLLSEREARSRLAGLLSSVHDLDDGIKAVATHLRRLVPFDAGRLVLLDESGGAEASWELAEGPGCEVTDAHADAQVPLRVEGRRVGLMRLSREEGAFSERDHEVMAAVAPLLASTLERIRLTDRLHLSEQLATVGGLSRMVAHEIRNPLNSLGLHLSLLERRLRGAVAEEVTGAAGEHIAVLRSEVRRLDQVVESYVALATGRGRAGADETDLRALVDEVLAVHRPWADERGIRLEVDLGEVPAEALVERTRIQQAVHNLVRNALEAVEGRPDPWMTVQLRIDGERLALHVADGGTGFKDAKRAFSPGYTTKAAGTGMGLPISLQIARLHGGTVSVRSVAGGGAEVVLILPRVAGRVTRAG